mmetsp:Transcript_24509/g.36317  ORF Transcript_24509/g.36317 Transcript_24509/m.36317 type:complete len:129 (-) Transcript_24509:130-516(-)
MIVVQCCSYNVMEELISHISGWDNVCHMPNNYDIKFCLRLLELAHYFGSECLEKVYVEMCLSKVTSKDVINAFETALKIHHKRFALITFGLLVKDAASLFVRCPKQPETHRAIKLLWTFLNLLVHHKS